MMILPAITCSPPKRLTPNIFGLESRPFLVLPPAFLCAIAIYLVLKLFGFFCRCFLGNFFRRFFRWFLCCGFCFRNFFHSGFFISSFCCYFCCYFCFFRFVCS